MRPKRTKYVVGMIVGGMLLLSPLVAYCAYRMAMGRALASLAAPGTGSGTALSLNIDTMLYSIVGGGAGFLLGVVVLASSIVALRRAERVQDGFTLSSGSQ